MLKIDNATYRRLHDMLEDWSWVMYDNKPTIVTSPDRKIRLSFSGDIFSINIRKIPYLGNIGYTRLENFRSSFRDPSFYPKVWYDALKNIDDFLVVAQLTIILEALDTKTISSVREIPLDIVKPL
jgi:hypothetical protein